MNESRQMIVNLPDLTDSDVVDMVRVLGAITDAFIKHQQKQLQQQCCHDNQPDLFCGQDDEGLPPF